MPDGSPDLHKYRELWSKFRVAAEPTMQRFQQCHSSPLKQQLSKLNQLLVSARHTEFGEAHEFSKIRTYDDFTHRVPISTWTEMSGWVDKAVVSEAAVLSAETPLFFEPTSGSSAQQKLIPYTPQLLFEFQSAIIVWLASLYDACPAIANGRGYWSMSPQVRAIEETSNGIPIGCGNDMSYLANSIVLTLLKSILDPPRLNDSFHDWRLDSMVAMINADDLSMISVWSPTFLLALLEPMLAVTSKQPTDNNRLREIRKHINPCRIEAFDRACESGNFTILWPKLVVLSTWTAGPSYSFARSLARYFPKARIVPKGLLATEGVVSISYGLMDHCPLALDSHFLEFLSPDGSVVLVDKVQQGEHYQPLLTTGGGLYRYNLGDVVEIERSDDTNFLCIRFVERADSRCDLVGEKLDESLARFVCSVAADAGVGVALVPSPKDSQPRYVLVLDEKDPVKARQLADAIECSLLTIHHYAQARDLGQLGCLELRRVASVSVLLQSAWESAGLLAGDYKPSVLVSSLPLAHVILEHCVVETGSSI